MTTAETVDDAAWLIHVSYGSTVFRRMHLVMAAGGYGTYDLG